MTTAEGSLALVDGHQPIGASSAPADVHRPDGRLDHEQGRSVTGVTERPGRWGTHGFEAGCLMAGGSNAITVGAWSGSSFLM
jgi:hypothetical protein